MKRWIGVGVLLAAIGLTGCSSLQTVEEHRQLELPLESIEALEIQTESGDLTLRGDDQAHVITVEATIRKSQNIADDDILITLEQDGNLARLVSETKGGFGLRYTDIDLTVTIPSTLPVSIVDDSGDIDISHLAGPLTIQDDSGDILINDVTGEVTIDDQSGDITIKNASALKLIHDESGQISLENTAGDLEIEDESGDMRITKHDGNLTISDGSGDIDIDTVTGDVVILEDGSGDRKVKKVSGAVTEK